MSSRAKQENSIGH